MQKKTFFGNLSKHEEDGSPLMHVDSPLLSGMSRNRSNSNLVSDDFKLQNQRSVTLEHQPQPSDGHSNKSIGDEVNNMQPLVLEGLSKLSKISSHARAAQRKRRNTFHQHGLGKRKRSSSKMEFDVEIDRASACSSPY